MNWGEGRREWMGKGIETDGGRRETRGKGKGRRLAGTGGGGGRGRGRGKGKVKGEGMRESIPWGQKGRGGINWERDRHGHSKKMGRESGNG
jgi:hypothetical protein